MDIKAVIFDLNGTVLTDEDEYGLAFKKVLHNLGLKVDLQYPHQGGIGVRENWIEFKSKYKFKTKKSIDDLVAETQNEYLKLVDRITLTDGFIDFVERLRREGIKTALATSNSYLLVDKIFEKFDIERYFDVVTTEEEVARNKPDPEIFLITSQKLDVAPEECVVFEDSQAGIDAAYEAGMKAVAIVADKGNEDFSKAELRINSFKEIVDKQWVF